MLIVSRADGELGGLKELYYSVHAIGVQSNFILPTKGFNLFFKYEPEYSAKARPEGRTFAFGFVWTLRDPRPAKP
jgi:hypothetical protein